jgi:hypothetical protein
VPVASRLPIVSSFPLIILAETFSASNGVFSLQGGQFSGVLHANNCLCQYRRSSEKYPDST